MTTPIGRFLNAFPDWVIPFACPAAVLIGVVIAVRIIRRGKPPLQWTGRKRVKIACISLWLLSVIAIGTFDFLRPVYQAYRADGWPTHQGVVKICEVIMHPPAPRTHQPTYSVGLRFAFTLDGQGYEGERYDVSVRPADHETAKQIVNAHPPGTVVTVHYNVVDPDESVLDTHLPKHVFDGIWIVAFLFALGGIFLVQSLISAVT